MRINFILPPCELSGGPLAILEYANKFVEKGHEVTVTTYPTMFWPEKWDKNTDPFPWYKDFKGKYVYARNKYYEEFIYKFIRRTYMRYGGNRPRKTLAGLRDIFDIFSVNSWLIGYMPECDINIATYWSSVFAVYFSQKGKPVYFMQHYEEVFLNAEYSHIFQRLLAKISYSMPMYKVANSSWLQKVIEEKYNQRVPFSNNALNVEEFAPRKKTSDEDGIIRIMTFCRAEEWKGFGDAAKVMSIIKKEYGDKVEWHVFGRMHPSIKPDNEYTPYILHEKIPFSELAKIYAECDITLCCSWYESFPLPPLESMASGTAVVTTGYGVEDYCIDKENCLIVGPRDIDGMVKAVKLLITDKKLRETLADNGLLTAQKYDWDTAVNNRLKILEDIHQGNTLYNRFESTYLSFKDANEIIFERLPSDLEAEVHDGELVEYDGMVFMISNGTKRHIANPDVFGKVVRPGTNIRKINEIEFARIPWGFAILTEYDA